MAPGGGVSGSIHRAAGPSLWEECKSIGGCNTGKAVLTSGYELKASYVIHTVGPVYSGTAEDPEVLGSCYRNTLEIARDNSIKSISFPAISTGIFGYPVAEAAEVALSTVMDFISENGSPDLVRFVLFDENAYKVHSDTLMRLTNE